MPTKAAHCLSACLPLMRAEHDAVESALLSQSIAAVWQGSNRQVEKLGTSFVKTTRFVLCCSVSIAKGGDGGEEGPWLVTGCLVPARSAFDRREGKTTCA